LETEQYEKGMHSKYYVIEGSVRIEAVNANFSQFLSSIICTQPQQWRLLLHPEKSIFRPTTFSEYRD